MSDRDPFAADARLRDHLSQEIFGVRLALWEAHEAKDGSAALAALRRMYDLLEKMPDAQVLYVGETAESFVLPPACRQMLARWGGRCLECDGPIRRGDIMYWEPHDRAMICVACGGIPGLAPERACKP